ncbi:hypothetical protein [Deinococcus sp.]|uniref:hypothetical protein n=1 Tax=Deinococcus sp. TaxID=47478 RepID=UPI003B5B57D7
MNKSVGALVLLLCASLAQAVTLRGNVEGVSGQGLRVGVWSVGPAGSAGDELASAALKGNAFTLSWPDAPPPSRAQYPLKPESIIWPGVVGNVTLSAPVTGSLANLFVYADSNGNGQRDESERLSEAFAEVGRQPLVIVWANGNTNVAAGRGFSASLKSGWNVFSVDLGRNASVKPYGGEPLNVRAQR